jgi:hypothetical protein
VSSFVPPPAPAGFVERSGSGWRLSVPTTWHDGSPNGAHAWTVVDPQVTDGLHAKVLVVTEPFAGESYDYARASEAGLKSTPHTAVGAARDEVIDGDTTLVLESTFAPGAGTAASDASDTHAPSAMKAMQTALASRGTGYVVSCAVAAGAFETYRSTCESIVRSFAVER